MSVEHFILNVNDMLEYLSVNSIIYYEKFLLILFSLTLYVRWIWITISATHLSWAFFHLLDPRNEWVTPYVLFDDITVVHV